MRLDNPYNYNLPVSSDMFFGRREELQSIFNDLTSSLGDSCALIAGRRMGKTSMLEAISRLIEAQTQSLRVLPAIVLIDLSGGYIDSVSSFFQVMLDKTAEYLESRHGIHLEVGQFSDDSSTVPLVEQTLAQ